jgi:putative hydrolase of the HAD superfamily
VGGGRIAAVSSPAPATPHPLLFFLTLSNVAAPLLWLFDLDDTLHNASHAIFPAIHVNMNRFIEETLRAAGLPCDPASVDVARQGYWIRYGATLLGMVEHHQVKPADFLAAAHRFDDLPSMIRAERGLARLLDRLPGRKILLTNAPRGYAREVVRHLGLHRHFAKHIPIELMRVHGRLRPKPSRLLLRSLLARERMPAGRCILVEDTLSTLKAAKSVGMRTVLVTGYQKARQRTSAGVTTAYRRRLGVDVTVRSLLTLPGFQCRWHLPRAVA